MKKGMTGPRRSWLDSGSWALLLEAQKESDLSIKDFCKSQGISAASYYRWQKRLGMDKEAGIELFSPIEIRSKSAGNIVVELPGGVVMRFEELPPVEYLRSLSCVFSGAGL